jgi:hypothetical protein
MGPRRKEGTKTPVAKEPLKQRSLSKGLTSMTFPKLTYLQTIGNFGGN